MRNLNFKVAKIKVITDLADSYGFLDEREGERMQVIYGEAGVGKTTAAKYLAEKKGDVFVTAHPYLTPFQLVKLILNEMGMTCRSLGEGLSKLISRFEESGQALFVDEIDFLVPNFHLLEILRTIHDEAGIQVVMIGMNNIFIPLYKHRQIYNRIHFCEFLPCSFQDTRTLADSLARVQIEADLLERIHKESKGNVRLIKWMIDYVNRHAKEMGLESCNLQNWGKQPLLSKYAQQPKKQRGVA